MPAGPGGTLMARSVVHPLLLTAGRSPRGPVQERAVEPALYSRYFTDCHGQRAPERFARSEKDGVMGLFAGKKGMVLGVANDFSIAWAITQKLLAEGAEVGFTHLPGDKMERRVRKLADPIGAKVITPCDVQNDEDVARVFDLAKETYGSLDFVLHSIAFAPIEDLKVPFVDSSRQGFKTAMDISVYSLAIVARHAARVLSEGGSHPDAHLSGWREGHSRVQPDGGLQGRTRRRRQVSGL